MYIDWTNRIIHIDRADMVQIQSSPTAIYQLDIPDFRKWLIDQQDNVDGIVYPDTHKHNTTVEVGGAVLARVVTIINNYTITFEDDKYAVNLVGANSNIADVVNVNQVSVRSANSAGLQDLTSLQSASFDNASVAIDVVNGFSGTVFPTGTLQRPVNNISDAMAIAKRAGMNDLFIIGDLTLYEGDDVANMTISGISSLASSLTIQSNVNTNNTTIKDLKFIGYLDNTSIVRECYIFTTIFNYGFMDRCGFTEETVVLRPNGAIQLIDCISSVAGYNTPTFDLSGEDGANQDHNLMVRGWIGGIRIKNRKGSNPISIDMASGHVIIDSSCTGDPIYIRGNYSLTVEDGATAPDIDAKTYTHDDNVPQKVWEVQL
jgi:hypothetical protein